ncbi:MAG: alpha/beta hydrolase [Micrococcales bacterium]|nr:alpha/beta hydrolase [Micrococcales bacterium]
MRSTTETHQTSDGMRLAMRRWLPDGEPKAVVQVAHGMAEHSERYGRLAERLTDAGYAVYAHDHRGHGPAAQAGTFGHFADSDGWDVAVDDIRSVMATAQGERPGLPFFLLGHSMGSLMARTLVIDGSDGITGLVLSGTAGDPGPIAKVGRAIALVEGRVRGGRKPSQIMNKLTFGQFNAAFTPARTDFDWLSRDTAEVDGYIADELCGQVSSSRLFADMLDGTQRIAKDENVARVRKDLPILLISGDADPVGGKGGEGVKGVLAQYQKAGVEDVSMWLYPGARHELFNETNRDEVVDDLIGWLDSHLPAS